MLKQNPVHVLQHALMCSFSLRNLPLQILVCMWRNALWYVYYASFIHVASYQPLSKTDLTRATFAHPCSTLRWQSCRFTIHLASEPTSLQKQVYRGFLGFFRNCNIGSFHRIIEKLCCGYHFILLSWKSSSPFQPVMMEKMLLWFENIKLLLFENWNYWNQFLKKCRKTEQLSFERLKCKRKSKAATTRSKEHFHVQNCKLIYWLQLRVHKGCGLIILDLPVADWWAHLKSHG